MKEISIIIPVYNAEKYIDKCIESLINQKFKNLEIIIVNDGSTDKSLEICRKYERIDSRIIVINKDNGGVSSARNIGLEVASGEYIGFVDPDDWVEEDMYYNMYNTLKSTSADVVICNYYEENRRKTKEVRLSGTKSILKENDIIQYIVSPMIATEDLNNGRSTLMGSVCRLLIKHSIIIDNNIRFKDYIPLMEDLIFSINIFLKSHIISIDNSISYHYRQNSVSAINRYRKDLKKIHDTVTFEIEALLKQENKYDLLIDRMKIRYVNDAMSCITMECHQHNKYNKISQKIFKIGQVCKDKKLKNIIKEVDKSNYSFRRKIILSSIINDRSIYLFVYYSAIMRCKKIIYLIKNI